MGAFWSFFMRKDPTTPIKSIFDRIKNIALNHFRGILAVIIALATLTWQGEKDVHHKTVQAMWIFMLIWWFFQPVAVPVTGLIPIFILPMCGCMNSSTTCICYFNENIALLILGGMLLLLLNNSGVDRRFALAIVGSSKDKNYSPIKLLMKYSLAAFLLSGICNRLLVSSILIQTVSQPLIYLQSATARYRQSEPDYDKLRYILCNAIHSSSAIGGLVFIHSAATTLCFKAILDENMHEDIHQFDAANKNVDEGSVVPSPAFQEKFPYLPYIAFALPVAIVMFIINLVYNIVRLKLAIKNSMSASSLAEMRKAVTKNKSEIPPKMTVHEVLTIVFTIIVLALVLFRDTGKWKFGWATAKGPGKIQDATVFALFLILLHIIPKSVGFLKIFTAKKRSDLKAIKPESSIIFWRFVDKNTCYAYILVLGAGIALDKAASRTGLSKIIGENLGNHITNSGWMMTALFVCFIAVFLSNIMPGVAVCSLMTPFAIAMCKHAKSQFAPELLKRVHIIALAVGMGTSLGFCCPFLNTPAFFSHYSGKVSILKMTAYGIGSSVICFIILFISIAFIAEHLFGFYELVTPAAGGGGGGGGGERFI